MRNGKTVGQNLYDYTEERMVGEIFFYVARLKLTKTERFIRTQYTNTKLFTFLFLLK